MNMRFQRMVAMILTCAMLISVLPTSVIAEEGFVPSPNSTVITTPTDTVPTDPASDPEMGIGSRSLDMETENDNRIMGIHVDDIIIGQSFHVTWDSVDYADHYEIAVVRIDTDGGETYLTSGTNHRKNTGTSCSFTVSAADVPSDTARFRIYVGAASTAYPCDYSQMIKENTVTISARYTESAEMDVTIYVDADGGYVSWDKVSNADHYVYSVYDMTDSIYIDSRVETTSRSFDISNQDVISGHKYRIWVGAYDETAALLAQHLAEVTLMLACAHPVTMNEDLPIYYDDSASTDTHHTLCNVYNVVCASCGEVLEENLTTPIKTEEHHFSNGVCEDCGYTKLSITLDYAFDANGNLTFTWNSVEGAASYEINYLINDVSAFGKKHSIGNVTSYQIKASELTVGDIVKFWIVAVDALGHEMTITPNTANTVQDTKFVTVPATEPLSITLDYAFDANGNLAFTWNSVEGAASYGINYRINDVAAFDAVHDVGGATSYQVPASQLSSGAVVKFWVGAYLADGSMVPVSSYTTDKVQDTITVTAPVQDGSLSVTIELPKVTATHGETISATAVVSGGSGEYNYGWTVSLDGTVVAEADMFVSKLYSYIADKVGSYVFTVTVMDSDGNKQIVSSKAITVTHDYETTTTYGTPVNESLDKHSVQVTTYQKCKNCYETTENVETLLQDHVYNNGIITEKAHPHNKYNKCACGATELIEGSGVKLNEDVCCSCNRHQWSGEPEEKNGEWREYCVNCGRYRTVDAPVNDTPAATLAPVENLLPDKEVVVLEEPEEVQDKVNVQKIKDEIHEWNKENYTLFDAASSVVLADKQNPVYRTAEAVYKASDIVGTTIDLLVSGAFGIDADTKMDSMLANLIIETYISGIGERFTALDEQVYEMMNELSMGSDAAGFTSGGITIIEEVAKVDANGAGDIAGNTGTALKLIYHGVEIQVDSMETLQYIYVMQRNYEDTIAYLDNLRKAAPDDSHIQSACDLVQESINKRWSIGEPVLLATTKKSHDAETAKLTLNAILDISNQVITFKTATDVSQAMQGAKDVSQAMIDARCYLGDGTPGTSVQAVMEQIKHNKTSIPSVLKTVGTYLTGWNVGNAIGKTLTFATGNKIKASDELLLLYILNSEAQRALGNVAASDMDMARDVAALYLRIQETGLEVSENYFQNVGIEHFMMSSPVVEMVHQITTGRPTYPTRAQLEEYLQKQVTMVNGLREEIGISDGYRLDVGYWLSWYDQHYPNSRDQSTIGMTGDSLSYDELAEEEGVSTGTKVYGMIAYAVNPGNVYVSPNRNSLVQSTFMPNEVFKVIAVDVQSLEDDSLWWKVNDQGNIGYIPKGDLQQMIE